MLSSAARYRLFQLPLRVRVELIVASIGLLACVGYRLVQLPHRVRYLRRRVELIVKSAAFDALSCSGHQLFSSRIEFKSS